MAYEFQNRLLKPRPAIIVLKGFLSPASQAFEYQKATAHPEQRVGKIASYVFFRQHIDSIASRQ